MRRNIFRALAACVTLSIVAGCNSGTTTNTPAAAAPAPTSPAISQLSSFRSTINHIIIIYQENWSFDSLYGNYPGANGYSRAGASLTNQVDVNGLPITTIPQPLNGGKADPRFPATLSVTPFNELNYISLSDTTGDPVHNFYIQQAEIDSGKMDKYLAYPTQGTQGGMPYSFVDATNLPEGQLAKQYVLYDNFSQSAFGGSFINNMWMTCACTAMAPVGAGPAEPFDANGNPTVLGSAEGRMTADGFVVNTSYTTQYPQITAPGPNLFVPPQTQPTIFDRLTAAGISWGFYSGGLNNALAGKPDTTFQAHHQSPLYFASFAPGTAGAKNIQDESNFYTALAAGNVPQVTFIKPLGLNNMHPGYTNVITGQTYENAIISQIQMSPIWKDAAIFIVYDEAGGHYDHVAPTPVDRWGPATRVPALLISPWAKRGIIDSTKLETVSILATIEQRFNLQPLGARDAAANTPIFTSFDFTQKAPQVFARRQLGVFPQVLAPASNPAPGRHSITELDD